MRSPLMVLFFFGAFGCSSAMLPAELADAGADGHQLADHDDAGVKASADAGLTDAGLPDSGPADSGPDGAALIAARPYVLREPSGSDGGTLPLVVLLHGYGATGQIQSLYFGLPAQADQSKFLLATPDGTLDSSGKRFWNASDACCNFENAAVDDVAYVNAIIDDVKAHHAVDAKRVFIIGHSNGGFMAHRMACDSAGRIAAIVSFAGAGPKVASRCQPSEGVAVLQVHGTADGTINYAGGALQGVEFPGAIETQTAWAARLGCQEARVQAGPALDLISTLAGAETQPERFEGCTRGAVELWTIAQGTHTPSLNQSAWTSALYGFLMAHPKP